MRLGKCGASGARAIVIEESLAQPLSAQWPGRLLSRRTHRLAGLAEVTVTEYALDADDIWPAMQSLADGLRSPGYYAHVVEENRMLVAFPGSVFLFSREDSDCIERCRTTGRLLGIPDSQMQFERMFDEDHPDLSQ